MVAECPDCGAPFSSAADLVDHMKKLHSSGGSLASQAMTSESTHQGLVCARWRERFWNSEAPERLNLAPDYRTHRPRSGIIPYYANA